MRDELVIYRASDESVYALNTSSRLVWELCDGQHSVKEIAQELSKVLEGDDSHVSDEILVDVRATVAKFQTLDLLQDKGPQSHEC